MKKIIASLLLCSMTLTSIASADPVQLPTVTKPPSEPDVGNAVSPMKKAQKAPFTGVLLSPGAVATVIVELGSIDERIKIEVDKATQTCKAESEFTFKEAQAKYVADKKVLQAAVEEKLKRISVLEDTIKKQEEEKTNPYLWTGIGFAGGVAVSVLTAIAITQATK